jgi:hypothetical protein
MEGKISTEGNCTEEGNVTGKGDLATPPPMTVTLLRLYILGIRHIFDFPEDSVFNEEGASTEGDTCVKGQRAVLPRLPPLLREASLPNKPTWHKG